MILKEWIKCYSEYKSYTNKMPIRFAWMSHVAQLHESRVPMWHCVCLVPKKGHVRSYDVIRDKGGGRGTLLSTWLLQRCVWLSPGRNTQSDCQCRHSTGSVACSKNLRTAFTGNRKTGWRC